MDAPKQTTTTTTTQPWRRTNRNPMKDTPTDTKTYTPTDTPTDTKIVAPATQSTKDTLCTVIANGGAASACPFGKQCTQNHTKPCMNGEDCYKKTCTWGHYDKEATCKVNGLKPGQHCGRLNCFAVHL